MVWWVLGLIPGTLFYLYPVEERFDISARRLFRWWRWISPFILGLCLQFAQDLVGLITDKRQPEPGLTDFLQSFLLALAVLEILRKIRKWFDKEITWEDNVVKRFIVQLGIDLPFVIIIILGSRAIFHAINGDSPDYSINEEFLMVGIGSAFIFFFVLIELGYFFLERWRRSLHEIERFKKENVEFQLSMLKTQVNPHFLFNSLNTLSSLIHSNADIAERFVRQLSKVYRNVLSSKDEEKIKVAKELELLEAYMELMHLRFGESLIIDINIRSANLDKFIAPLTFQMLMENAVKHNINEHDRPLRIEIFSEGEFMVVRNNLQKKITSMETSKIGLKNISSRYLFLSDKDIVVEESDEYFTVKVPLLD